MTDTTTTAEMLVQDTLGRVRTPREKRERILDEYERSGMSGAAFAALVGVKYPMLSLAGTMQQRRNSTCDRPWCSQGAQASRLCCLVVTGGTPVPPARRADSITKS